MTEPYRAPTGWPQDWGMEAPSHPRLAYIQQGSKGNPPLLMAINGLSQTAVPLDRRMMSLLLTQISEAIAREIEGV